MHHSGCVHRAGHRARLTTYRTYNRSAISCNFAWLAAKNRPSNRPFRSFSIRTCQLWALLPSRSRIPASSAERTGSRFAAACVLSPPTEGLSAEIESNRRSPALAGVMCPEADKAVPSAGRHPRRTNPRRCQGRAVEARANDYPSRRIHRQPPRNNWQVPRADSRSTPYGCVPHHPASGRVAHSELCSGTSG